MQCCFKASHDAAGEQAASFRLHFAGLLVVRGALEPALQRQLVMDAFTRFCEPPNHTNHTKAYPGGLPGIWIAAQQGLRLQQVAAQPKELEQAHQEQEQQQQEVAPAVTRTEPQSVAPAAPAAGVWGPGGSGPTAESLLVRLRWATLGPPYDWTQRTYRQDVQHVPLPAPLHQLAASLADLAAQLLGEGGDQQGLLAQARPYCPDAALVNFYYEGKEEELQHCNTGRGLHHALLLAMHHPALASCLPASPPMCRRHAERAH